MTTKKGKITDRNNFAIEPLFPRYVGYADYFLATPVSVQVRNDSSEAVTLQVSVESESGLLVPYETQAEVPFESSVELTAEQVLAGSDSVSGVDLSRIVPLVDRLYVTGSGDRAALEAAVEPLLEGRDPASFLVLEP